MTRPPQRLDLDYRIEWLGTWRVGSGFGTAQADRLVRRRGGRLGTAFVPGSQLKGVLRHHCERLLATLAPGLPVVAPHATGREQQKALVRHFRPLGQSTAMVDRLFGTRYQGDCLYVDDALPEETTAPGLAEEPRFITRSAMDRLTGTVKEGHLFVTEVSEPGSQILRGRIRARHPGDALLPYEGFPLEYSLLVAALRGIECLGGDKSTGQGRCQVSLDDEQAIRWHDGRREVSHSVAEVLALFGSDEWSTYVALYEEGTDRS